MDDDDDGEKVEHIKNNFREMVKPFLVNANFIISIPFRLLLRLARFPPAQMSAMAARLNLPLVVLATKQFIIALEARRVETAAAGSALQAALVIGRLDHLHDVSITYRLHAPAANYICRCRCCCHGRRRTC
jgi:hypothetical protein